MSKYELRSKDGRREIEDLSALLSLVRAGGVKPEDLVSRDGAPPVAAQRLPELKDAFGVDIWAAWEDMDEDEPPPMPPSAPAAREPAPLPTAALTVEEPVEPAPPDPVAPKPAPAAPTAPAAPAVSQPRTPARPRAAAPEAPPLGEPGADRAQPKRLVIVSSRRADGAPAVESLPLGAVEPLRNDATPSDPISDGPGGEVIAFPVPPRPQARPLPRLIEPEDDAAAPVRISREAAEVERIPPRYLWMGALAVVALVGTAIFVWYMRSVALWTNPPVIEEPGVVDEGPEEPLVETPAVEAPVVSPPSADDEGLMTQLRAKIPRDAGTFEGSEEELGDLLFVELQRAVSPRSVQVRVIARNRTGVPEVVELRFVLNAGEDVLRDLGAVALVAGKYKVQYDLQVRRIEAVLVGADGVERSRELSPEGCGQLWNARLSLAELLLSQ